MAGLTRSQQIPGVHLFPAVVYEYLPDTRQCRIEVEGITSGSEDRLLAEIMMAIGDKGHHTEINILKGDMVWVAFLNGDMRYPIIMGYRNRDTGNSQGSRRWHHANIEWQATDTVRITAKNIILESDSLTHNGVNIGSTHTHGKVKVGTDKTDIPE